jgi:hypothetical protein
VLIACTVAIAVLVTLADPFLPLLLGIAGALVVLGAVAAYPTAALYLLVVSLFTLDAAASIELLPRRVTWFPELVLAGLTIRLVLSRATCAASGGLGRSVLGAGLLALLAAAVLSAVASVTPPAVFALGMRAHFEYVWLFLVVLYLGIDQKTRLRLLVLFWALMWPQPVIVAIQRYSTDCPNCYVDAYSGSLGSTATLAVMAGFVGALAAASYTERGQWRVPVLGALMAVALGLAEAKAGFFFLAIGSGVVVAARLAVNLTGRLLARAALLLVLGLGALYGAAAVGGQLLNLDLIRLFTSPAAAIEYDWVYDPAAGRYAGRAYDLGLAMESSRTLPWHGVLGAGPGAGSESVFEEFTGALYRERATVIGRSVFWVHGARVLVELGWLGVAATVTTLAGIVLVALRGVRRSMTLDLRVQSLALIGFAAVVAAAHFYQTILDIPSCALWLTTAAVWPSAAARREDASSG